MAHRLKTPEGRKLYSLRKQIPGTSVRHHQLGPRIPPVPAARARQGAWRVEPRDHGMEHQADVHPQLRLILPDAGPGCEKNGRRATWPVTTRSGRHQVPVAVLPTAKSLSAFSLKPQSDRLLGESVISIRNLGPLGLPFTPWLVAP